MKKLFVLMIVSLTVNSLFAQIPIPDFVNKVHYVQEDNTLGNLENVDATIDYKLKGMGYGGIEYFFTAFSNKSSKRFKQNDVPKFVIRVKDDVDPSEFITLSIGEIKKKKKRQFKQGSMSATGKSRDNSMFVVSLDFKKIGDNYFEVIPQQELTLGEYAFVRILNQENQTSTKIKIYCFGID